MKKWIETKYMNECLFPYLFVFKLLLSPIACALLRYLFDLGPKAIVRSYGCGFGWNLFFSLFFDLLFNILKREVFKI